MDAPVYLLNSSNWADAKLTQLRMEYRRFPRLPADRPAAGYELRAFAPGDENAWAELLSLSDLGQWDRARIDGTIAGERGALPLDSAIFAIYDGQPVATAHAELRKEPGPELSWVAVHPAHRGKGLAYPLCRAVLAWAAKQGHSYVYLTTHDFRIGAIKTYLNLGFEPAMLDETHPRRWSDLAAALAARRQPAQS